VPFVPVQYVPASEVTDEEYPLSLQPQEPLPVSFRLHDQESGAHRGPRRRSLCRDKPKDAKRLSITNGDTVKVSLGEGRSTIRARVTRTVSEGTVFVPMHYYEAAANMLTNDALDPKVKIPELKVCAVKVFSAVKMPDK